MTVQNLTKWVPYNIEQREKAYANEKCCELTELHEVK